MDTDVLIVGSGIAGLYTALNIDPALHVLIVTKKEVCYCNSYLAQGGISVARDEEDFERFFEDTCKAGGYENNREAVEILVRESRENLDKLIELGVNFDTKDGRLHYTREAAHEINRILHCEDRTGAVVHDALFKRCAEKENIKIIENCLMEDILIEEGQCSGILANIYGKEERIRAQRVVLATGGIGGLFKSTTNKTAILGQGMAIALRHGLKMKDLDKIQFHPTAFYEKGRKQRFLISESVRGEGGILINHRGERFVNEMEPRDKLTMAIYNELKKSGEKYVFLDMKHLGKEYIVNRFPSIYQECLSRGTDITRDLIPVSPAQHYMMGGIEVDMDSRTSMKNLFAVGEVSCTGVHGHNRLASNSLLESLVFSRRAAKAINRAVHSMTKEDIPGSAKKINRVTVHENEGLLKDKILSLRGDLKDELCDY